MIFSDKLIIMALFTLCISHQAKAEEQGETASQVSSSEVKKVSDNIKISETLLPQLKTQNWKCNPPRWFRELLGSALESTNDNNAPVTHGQLKYLIYYWYTALHGQNRLIEDLHMCDPTTPPPVSGNWTETGFVHDRSLYKIMVELFPFDRLCGQPCGGGVYNDEPLKKEIVNLMNEINQLKNVINDLRSRNIMRSAPEDITFLREKITPKAIYVPK